MEAAAGVDAGHAAETCNEMEAAAGVDAGAGGGGGADNMEVFGSTGATTQGTGICNMGATPGAMTPAVMFGTIDGNPP